MNRRLFNLAAAVSLVLCVATVVLWVRGRLTWKYGQVAFNCGIRDDGGLLARRGLIRQYLRLGLSGIARRQSNAGRADSYRRN